MRGLRIGGSHKHPWNPVCIKGAPQSDNVSGQHTFWPMSRVNRARKMKHLLPASIHDPPAWHSLLVLAAALSPHSMQAWPGLFGPEGCIAIILWGLAYLSVAFGGWREVPYLVLVFGIEKVGVASPVGLWERTCRKF